jgi:class 3 adenylate cyclase/ActR/RegA family two-component response regulator
LTRWAVAGIRGRIVGVTISVVLADDNLLVREGVRALLNRAEDLEVVGVAADYDELVAAATSQTPQVVVTDIRMPPTFQREGIEAAAEIRRRQPGVGVVVLSQYDDPDYAVALLADGSAGYAYLLKDRIAEGDQLAQAIRRVAGGGTMLDPQIVDGLMRPVRTDGGLSDEQEELLRLIAEGRTLKAIAVARNTTAEAISDLVEGVFLDLAREASTGASGALRRLRMLHQAIVDREEQGETLSRLLPTGVAEQVREGGVAIGETTKMTVTVLMSDIRGYTSIAEHADPAALASQLNTHRAVMNKAILDEGGTVMQYVGDAVMAVFGAPRPNDVHPTAAFAASEAMHAAQWEVNERWLADGLPPFGLGIGVSTGEVAAALLGSEERLEYTVVGDAVNLCQRLQQFAEPGQSVFSEVTWASLTDRPPEAEHLPPQMVKGRDTPVAPWRITSQAWAPGGALGTPTPVEGTFT